MSNNTMYDQRFNRVMENLGDMGLTQMLVCDPSSIAWLCGFSVDPGERFFALLLQEGRPPRMILNDLFPAPADLDLEICGYRDTDDPLALLSGLCDASAPLGCDKTMAACFLLPLEGSHAAAGFVLGSKAIDDARALKDDYELDCMRRASATNDAAMAWLVAQVREGVTEAGIAARLLDEYRRLGAQEFSFPPIVCFGAHAADPHHTPDDTVLAAGDAVLFDVGCIQDGYCSDMTRTFFYKSATDEERRIYETVREANEAAAAVVAPGVTFAAIDRAGRDIIDAAGYGREFTHRLGHSIGTCDHEPGDVSETNHDPVQPGMCFSDEPGIYLSGRFGVRIEDLIVVTETGHEILNAYPRDLIILE